MYRKALFQPGRTTTPKIQPFHTTWRITKAYVTRRVCNTQSCNFLETAKDKLALCDPFSSLESFKAPATAKVALLHYSTWLECSHIIWNVNNFVPEIWRKLEERAILLIQMFLTYEGEFVLIVSVDLYMCVYTHFIATPTLNVLDLAWNKLRTSLFGLLFYFRRNGEFLFDIYLFYQLTLFLHFYLFQDLNGAPPLPTRSIYILILHYLSVYI